MMSLKSRMYSCSKCDAQFTKWSGRCLECGAWGTLKESSLQQALKNKSAVASLSTAAPARVRALDELGAESLRRIASGEFPARVMFPQGLVIGSLTLLTGEPGAGKSTLCLQLAQNFSTSAKVLYITSEESAAQIKERGTRIGAWGKGFSIAESTNI